MEYSFYDFLKLIGSLGLFLYGMKIMSEGLQKVAGDRLRSILTAMTTNRVTGVLTGVLITALIQSSSATTVILDALFLIALRAQELAEFLHHGGGVVEPVHQFFRQLVLIGDTVEVFQKDLVEFVVIRLGFDKHRAAELIEACKRIVLQVQHQSLNERHPLVQAGKRGKEVPVRMYDHKG